MALDQALIDDRMLRPPANEYLKKVALRIHCQMPWSPLCMSGIRQGNSRFLRKAIPYFPDVFFDLRILAVVLRQTCLGHNVLSRIANELIESREHWPVTPGFDSIRNERSSSGRDMILVCDVDELLHLQCTDFLVLSTTSLTGIEEQSRGLHRRYLAQWFSRRPAHCPTSFAAYPWPQGGNPRILGLLAPI